MGHNDAIHQRIADGDKITHDRFAFDVFGSRGGCFVEPRRGCCSNGDGGRASVNESESASESVSETG